nr:phage holin family protein [Sphingobium jiangsuense]
MAIVRANIWWIIAGIGGRMIFHGREAQAGRRHFWGKELPFEMLVAVGMAFVGKAVATYSGLGPEPATAAAGIAAYLGPRAIDALYDRATKRA